MRSASFAQLLLSAGCWSSLLATLCPLQHRSVPVSISIAANARLRKLPYSVFPSIGGPRLTAHYRPTPYPCVSLSPGSPSAE
ncbi:hypothetical protein PR003_g5903 [Phytophthora rubi]|uniref:RxLR effector protein n=1 Tax=Phytophthora rubi TaxID=129364 RepID=A0A6A3LCS5_9STRA|nr:hypothetical protein PR002_g13891 [Phytophthora rubi]KAE9017226.1 hypothetical protein PR001_g14453 [Phytophthora rubi]KAE9349428.1 hypothetical protein PR003_g5903 [Phytophthora rubi]